MITRYLPGIRARRLLGWTFTLGMLVGVGLMIDSSLSYLEYGDAHPFVLEKLPLWSEEAFLWALYVHVPSSLFALPVCLVLSSHLVRRGFPRFHRWLGRITAANILLLVFPSGVVLSFSATGGWVSTLGFLATAGITAFAMVMSVRAARVGDVRAHRRYSIHVTAQLSVAVTSRVALMVCAAAGYDPIVSYVAALWLPVVGGALIAEAIASPRRLSPSRVMHAFRPLSNPS